MSKLQSKDKVHRDANTVRLSALMLAAKFSTAAFAINNAMMSGDDEGAVAIWKEASHGRVILEVEDGEGKIVYTPGPSVYNEGGKDA